MSDPQTSGAPVSEEELQEYVRRLRATPAEQVVTEVLSALLQAGQAKLGRRDARLLVDLSGLVLDHARQHVSAELASQVDQVLSQLRLAQVRAEEQAAAGGGVPEPGDLAQTPAAPETPETPQSTPSQQQQPRQPSPPAASRLWIPGRDF